MSRVKPAEIIKTNYFISGSAGLTRQVLVILQFAAAIVLICSTFIVYKQVRFMEKHDLGVNIDQTIVLKFPVSREELIQKITLFAENLKTEPFIQSVSLAGSVPEMEVAYFASNRLEGETSEQHRLYEMLTVDEGFVDTFGFRLLAGRSFQKGFGNERESLLINEAAMLYLNINKQEDAIFISILGLWALTALNVSKKVKEAGIMTLAIAVITVVLQSWRAATRNPVEALRYE